MRRGAVLAFAVVALAAPTLAQAPAAPLATRLAEVATGFCIDILSRRVPLPPDPAGEQALFARYGVQPGLPGDAMQALGRDVGLVSQAVLASGQAADGAFMVAIGGRAGQTCRLIVYRAPAQGDLAAATRTALQAPALGWRDVPVTQQSPAVRKLSLLKRDAQRAPFLVNLLVPTTPGPVAMVANVAAIPPGVTLPDGY